MKWEYKIDGSRNWFVPNRVYFCETLAEAIEAWLAEQADLVDA